MIIPHHLKHERILVVGLGKTGFSVCQALQAAGADVSIWDEKVEAVERAVQKGYGKPFIPETLETFHKTILSPGIAWRWPKPAAIIHTLRQGGIPLVTDLDIFASTLYRQGWQGRLIGVTGTNGKSTTTALLGHVLQQLGKRCQIGGNVGIPVLALDPGQEIYVLELSSYQLEMSHHLHMQDAILLNITPDHLSRHGGMTGYMTAKAAVFEGIENGRAVIGLDTPLSVQLYKELSPFLGEILYPIATTTALSEGVYVTPEGKLVEKRSGKITYTAPLTSLPTLQGSHNWQNAAAVYALIRTYESNPDRILTAMQSFPGLAHRQEKVGDWQNVIFVNDSKATNAEAAAKALATYENVYWIAGGLPKEDGIESLRDLFPRIKHAFLIGEAATQFAAVLSRYRVPFTLSHVLPQAVEDAYQAASHGGDGTVLLSPACASWDQFKSFEERGDVFRDTVQRLITRLNG